MSFCLNKFIAPDFGEARFREATDARLVEVKKVGVAPEGFHALSIYPEYFKIEGKWYLAEESRMDTVPVFRNKRIEALEARKLQKGDLVVIGKSEDLEEGIYLYDQGFARSQDKEDPFTFRSGRSRETSFSKEYEDLCELLKYEKENGHILWVLGPAFTFDRKARQAFESLVENGYVDGLLAGNALATHDLEVAYFGTALGQDINTGENVHNGHYHHLEVINKVRAYGDIRQFIENEKIADGIIYALEKNAVPYVLAGSIRDDGPLPEVEGDVYRAQDKMREHVSRATTIICMASALHSIAVGNMAPSYRVMGDGTIRELYFYLVDVSEFITNKLADRGSLTSRAIISNVQDFIVKLTDGLGI